MTIGDLSHFGSSAGAQRDPAPRIVRGKVVRAPANKNDGLMVAEEGYAVAFPAEIPPGHWTQRGTLLPALGAVCVVIFDGRDAWMVGYEGTVP